MQKKVEEMTQIQKNLMGVVNHKVYRERLRQNTKWGVQRHNDGDWLKILVEEVGELAQAMQVSKGWGKDTDAQNKIEEAIHVAAVACAMAEHFMEEEAKAKGQI